MPRHLTVKELKETIAGLEDNVIVLAPWADHGYRAIQVEVSTALEELPNVFIMDSGEEFTPEAQYGKRVPAVIIS